MTISQYIIMRPRVTSLYLLIIQAMISVPPVLPLLQKTMPIPNPKQIDRGVTLLDGTGWYSKQGIKVVVVLAKKSQSLDIFRLVKDIDPNAFISQSNVVGVYGEGFDKLKIK